MNVKNEKGVNQLMRRSIAAIAVIRLRDEYGQTLWLAQWNKNWNAYAFIGGHKRPDESFRDCMLREVSEELGLTEKADFLVASEPLARLEYTAWSQSAQEDTAYTMELFDVQLTDTARQKLQTNPANRWLTEDELQTQQTSDKKPVSSTMPLLLRKAGLLTETRTDGSTNTPTQGR